MPPKAKPNRTTIIVVAQAAEHDSADDDEAVMHQAGDDIAEIAAEEAVAAFAFDAAGEFGADLGDRAAIGAVDLGDAAAGSFTQSKMARSPGGSAAMPPSGSFFGVFSVSVLSLSSKRISPRTASDSAAAVKARHFSRPKPQRWM